MKSCETCKHWKENMGTNRKPYKNRNGQCDINLDDIPSYSNDPYSEGDPMIPTHPLEGEKCPVWEAK